MVVCIVHDFTVMDGNCLARFEKELVDLKKANCELTAKLETEEDVNIQKYEMFEVRVRMLQSHLASQAKSVAEAQREIARLNDIVRGISTCTFDKVKPDVLRQTLPRIDDKRLKRRHFKKDQLTMDGESRRERRLRLSRERQKRWRGRMSEETLARMRRRNAERMAYMRKMETPEQAEVRRRTQAQRVKKARSRAEIEPNQ